MNGQIKHSRVSKWGWGILLAISVLLVLNGVSLFFISASPDTFEQDTGVPMSEVSQAFPTVVDEVVGAGQNLSILLAGIGLISLMVAWEGFRRQTRWAWNTLWVLAATLLVAGLKSVLLDGRLDIGGLYLVLAVVTLVGQLLARVNTHPGRSNIIGSASILFYVTGTLGVLFFLPTTVVTAFLGTQVFARIGLNIAEMGNIQATGGAVFLVSVALFTAFSALEIVAARWLGRSLKKGAILGIAAMVPGFILSIGMVLPIWLLLHPIKFVLVLAAWNRLQ